MRLPRLLLALLTILSFQLAAHAAPPATSQSEKIEFSEETLDNGLHVIYAPLHQAPVVHVRVLYHVGSRDERADRQGFAHMFEHMMFRGSAHVAPEEHMKRIGQVGGISNAFTSFDETVYVNTVPAQYLDMALWLEADRMASFKVSDQIFQTERKVVAEEWRMKNNQPYGNLFEIFLKNAYTTHSYRWTPIGNMDHLKAARSNELQEFFNTYYVPNNATLVIAGDFELDQAKKLVKAYYGWIPKAPAPPRDQIKTEPEQTEARSAEANEAVPLTVMMIGYHIPPYTSDDNYALSVLSTILGTGDSSRLNRLLVNSEKPLCVSADVTHWQAEDAGMFGVGGTVMAGKDPEQVRKMVADAVTDVVKNGVTQEELDKAKEIVKVGMVHGRETATDLASSLGEEYLFGGDANRVNTSLAKVEALTPADVQKVAAKYLLPERSTTLAMKPSVLAALNAKAASTQAAAVKAAPVAPSTAPIATRTIEFPKSYPTTAPSADPRKNPEFVKGIESAVDGVKVIVMPDHRLPIINWSVTMRRGSQSDPKGKEGVAWLTAEMLRRGVKGMTFEELTKDLDSRAISISVGDNGDNTRLNGSAISDQLDHAIERSRQILHEPTFPADEFAKLKEQSLSSLLLQQESPTSVAGNEMTTALFGDTPIGRYSTPRSVKTITLDDVKQFYRQIFQPADAVVIISGDVTVERGQELAKQLLAGWEKGDAAPVVEIDLPKPATKRRIILVDRPEGKQSTVRLGIPAYTIRSEDKFAGSIASQILTAGIDSRLGRYVRAKKGLAYSVYGVFQPNRQAGSFGGGVDTAVETTADAVEAMFTVFSEMQKANVSDQELKEAKMRVAGSMVMKVQTIGQQADYRVEGILNDYPIDYYDKYPERIAKVSADQVREVMNKYVNDDAITIIVVGPAEVVKPQLEKLGEVTVIPMPAKRAGAVTQPSRELLKKAA
jgi:zinc protease